jgi:hypothetical protein
MENSISGKWTFNEEFECGLDKGFAYIQQDNQNLAGYFEYEEIIEEDEPFVIKQEFSGTIQDNKIHIVGTKAIHSNGQPAHDYNLDILDGVLTHEGKIVGHSFDSDDICGVFVMERV